MKRTPIIIQLLSLVICFCGLLTSIYAKESNGSITITLEDTQTNLSKENVEIALVMVADKNYQLISPFLDIDLDFETITTSNELEETARTLKNNIPENLPLTSLKTDRMGTCIFKNLKEGVYLLFPLDSADYDNIVPSLVVLPDLDTMNDDIHIQPKHTPQPSIRVHKVDGENPDLKLKSANFTLYNQEMVELQIATTNQDGITEFYNLDYGIYYLKETKAPQGYQLEKELMEIKVEDEKLYEITVENKILPSIQTGDHADIMLYGGLSLFSILGVSMLLFKRKKA